MRIFSKVCMFVMVVVASSCNIDDVITITLEDSSYRAATPSSAVLWDKVYDYTPAPGQFINIQLAGKYLRRPISICDFDAETITIIYKVVGQGTAAMAKMQNIKNATPLIESMFSISVIFFLLIYNIISNTRLL